MQLSDFIDFSSVRSAMSAHDKRGVLQRLGQAAASEWALDAGAVSDALNEREALGSTGFGGGVAIPHGKLDGLEEVHGLVARLDKPIDYDAIDRMPVDIIFMILSPPDAGADHLRALAAVSRVARHGTLIEKMRGARGKDALAAVLMGADEPTPA